jgi:hypothetical protein
MMMYIALHVDTGTTEAHEVLKNPVFSTLQFSTFLRPTFASAIKAILATCDLYFVLLPHATSNTAIGELITSLDVARSLDKASQTYINTRTDMPKTTVAHTTFSIQEELQASKPELPETSTINAEAHASALETIRNATSLKSCTPEYKCPLAVALDGKGKVTAVGDNAETSGTLQRHIFLACDGVRFAMTSAVFELNTHTNTITVHMCTSPNNSQANGSITDFPALCHQLALKFGDVNKYTVQVFIFDTPKDGKAPIPGGDPVPDYWTVAFLITRLFLYHTPFFDANDGSKFQWPGFFTSDIVVRNTVMEVLLSCDIKAHKTIHKIGRRFGISQTGNSFASIARCVCAIAKTVSDLTRSTSLPSPCDGRRVSAMHIEVEAGVNRQRVEWLSKFHLNIDATVLANAASDDGVRLTKHILRLLKQRQYLCGLHHPYITYPRIRQRTRVQTGLLAVLSDSDEEELAGYQHVGTPRQSASTRKQPKRVATTALDGLPHHKVLKSASTSLFKP